jgi:hypothetical protein
MVSGGTGEYHVSDKYIAIFSKFFPMWTLTERNLIGKHLNISANTQNSGWQVESFHPKEVFTYPLVTSLLPGASPGFS